MGDRSSGNADGLTPVDPIRCFIPFFRSISCHYFGNGTKMFYSF